VERRDEERGEVQWRTAGALPLYRGRGGGLRLMIKMEKWPMINGDETTQF
jgi:hypothetical protein